MKSEIHPEIPEGAALTDPDVLERISHIHFASGALSIVPEDRRGPDYRPERCWLRECPEVGFSFLDEVRVFLVFGEKQVYLARAHTKTDLSPDGQKLHFKFNDVDLKPLLAEHGPFELRVVAQARLPERSVYIDGTFRLRVGFDIQ